jgi:hypothetical protein
VTQGLYLARRLLARLGRDNVAGYGANVHGVWRMASVLLLAMPMAQAAVLPEDRMDAMYHYYDGGGTKVDGPALLVRKEFADTASVYASYYADSISGASIDVVTTASPYKETRQEHSVGVDYLHGNTTMNLSYTESDEPDYLADTVSINVVHEVFDGLTTVSLGYTAGSDEVGKNGTDFREDLNRYQYRLGLSQVFTRTFLVNFEYEGILENGYLNSPYRAARLQGLLVPEQYPGTRDSYAFAVRALKGLTTPDDRLGSSVQLGYRYFWDTWDIRASTIETGYQRYFGGRWLGEIHYRYYSQTAASFYSDNFETQMNYMARDKELSTFNSHTVGGKLTYTFQKHPSFVNKSTFNVAYDYLKFEYDDFTDARTQTPYAFSVNVVQLFLSVWY